jgi:hypothetical protein
MRDSEKFGGNYARFGIFAKIWGLVFGIIALLYLLIILPPVGAAGAGVAGAGVARATTHA